MTAMDSDWRKVDPDRNCFRVYTIRLERDLFEPYRVCCQWGHIGSRNMQRLIRVFPSFENAACYIEKAVSERVKKNYERVPNMAPTAT